MPSNLPGPNYWTATKIRWEKIAQIHFGYATPQYIADGLSVDRYVHAEDSLNREGYLEKDKATRTPKGIKLSLEWLSQGKLFDRTP